MAYIVHYGFRSTFAGLYQAQIHSKAHPPHYVVAGWTALYIGSLTAINLILRNKNTHPKLWFVLLRKRLYI